MRTIETIRRSGVAVTPERTIRDAAAVMDAAGVGCLAVVEHDAIVGIVTDRDLVRRAIARRRDVDARVDGVMSTPVVTVDAGADIREVYALFRRNAIRRLPVVERGRFVGIISLDDLIVDLAADFADLVRPVTAEILFAHHDPEVPVVL